MPATLLLLLALAAAPAQPSATAPLFPGIEGWKVSEGPTRYSPETLYEYIDGAADAFLEQDFEELAAAIYANAEKVEVTVEVYRHREPVRAFAMYSQERPAGAAPLPIGIEGHAGSDHLEFVVGPYYVKLSQSGGRGGTQFRAIGEKVAAGLPGTREPPAVLKCFPEKGKRPRAEKLAARNVLGHGFLHDGFTASYEVAGARFRLFAVQGKDGADAREMLKRYVAAGAMPEAAAGPEGSATIKDPLNGAVDLQWKGRWIWGAVDEPSGSRKALVEELGRNLAASRL